MSEGQGGSPCTDLMRPGHYLLQVWARLRIGSCNQLCWPLRPAGQSDVLRIACIPGEEEAATGHAKSASRPPINRQGQEGAKGMDLVITADSGGAGLDMDDREGSPGDWLLARKSGRKQWEIDPSGSYATSRANCSGHAPD